MIAWIIVLVILAILAAVLFVIQKNNYSNFCLMAGVMLCFVVTVILVGAIGQSLAIQNQMAVFENQSAYIATHIPNDSIENAALTNKKIELNDWLFSAQWAKVKFGVFSLYPQDILDFEPIQ